MKKWTIRPEKPEPTKVPKKAMDKINAFAEQFTHDLKKKCITKKPRKKFNYISDIYGKWNKNRFYLCTKYACPSPNALSPAFESKFARLERYSNGSFGLFTMRHTGKWMQILPNDTLQKCFKELKNNPWFNQGM